MQIRTIPMWGLPLALTFIGCNKGEDTGHAGEDPAEHACEQVGSAGGAVSAAADLAGAEGVEIHVSEDPHTVTLVSGASGFVGVHVDEDTEALLFLDTADVVQAIYHEGVQESLPSPAPNELCGDDLPEHYELDLHAGAWALELGPAAVESVWLMLIAAEGHDHEH